MEIDYWKRIILIVNISLLGYYQLLAQTVNKGEQYRQKAIKGIEKDEIDTAIYYFQRASVYFRNAQKWEAYIKTQNDLSKIWLQLHLTDSLQLSAQAAFDLCENIASNQYQRIKAIYYQGIAQYYGGHTADATLLLLQTAHAFRTYYISQKNDLANTYRYLGEVKYKLLQYDSALFYAKKALQTFDTLDFQVMRLLEVNHDIAETAILAGKVYKEIGELENALTYFDRAIEARQSIRGNKNPNLYQPYLFTANTLIELNNLELAYQYNQQAQLLVQNTHYYAEVEPFIIKNRADIHAKKGNIEQALIDYKNALGRFNNISNKDKMREIAQIYASLGEIDAQKNTSQAFLEQFAKAEKIHKTLFGNYHPETAVLYYKWAGAYRSQKKTKEALDCIEKSLEIYKFLFGNKHPFAAKVYNLQATILLEDSQYDASLRASQMAIVANIKGFDNPDVLSYPLPQGYQDANILLESFFLKALSLERLALQAPSKYQVSGLESALYAYLYCDQITENLRRNRQNYGDKLALTENARKLYGGAVRVSSKLFALTKKSRYRDQVFYFAEKSRIPVLTDEIAEQQAKDQYDPNAAAEEKKLKINLAALKQKISLEKQPEKIQEIQIDIFNAQRQLEKYQQTVKRNIDVEYKSNNLTIKDLQKILDKNAAVRSYFIQDSVLYIHTIAKKFSYLEVLPKHPKLEKIIKAFRMGIVHHNDLIYEELGYELYKILFPKPLPPNVYRLIIIPDVELSTIPFEALLTQATQSDTVHQMKNLPYLIKDYFISYSYSATLFWTTFRKESTPKTVHPYQFVGFAPVFDKKNNTDAEPTSSGELGLITFDKVAAIPQTETEVRQIANLFLQNNQTVADVYIRLDANEGRVKNGQLHQYRYIHWATHGLVHPRNPELSCILMANEFTSGEDGYLFSGEIANLRLTADLVTLSACETGLGQLNKGEGLIGLTRSLLTAGAKNAIVSLWKVADESTSQLMIDFYKSILREDITDYSIPFHTAKRNMIERGGIYAHPYYWSAFILNGR